MIPLQTRELVLKWKKDGKTQQEIAELIGCNQSAVSRLIVKYKKTGNVKNIHRSGRPTPLSKDTLSKLKKEFKKEARAENKKFCSINTKKFSKMIKDKTGKEYSSRHVERILHKLEFSLQTPRSKHIMNDPKKIKEFRQEFKKNEKQSIWVMKL